MSEAEAFGEILQGINGSMGKLIKRIGDMEEEFASIKALLAIQPQGNTRPYACPVCQGEGRIPYYPMSSMSTGMASLKDCHPCQGTGVLWR